MTGAFDDLLAANRTFAETFMLGGYGGVAPDRLAALDEDICTRPLIPDAVAVGGFMSDLGTGLIEQKV